MLIRFIENINNELFYKSGGGITSDSIAKEEYEELTKKQKRELKFQKLMKI